MNFSAPPLRRIASNRLWTPQGIVLRPVVTVGPDGTILRVEVCAEPDRLPATEFYSGMLVPGFPADYREAFERLRCAREALPLTLPRFVPSSGGVLVVISGIDPQSMRLMPQAQIRKL